MNFCSFKTLLSRSTNLFSTYTLCSMVSNFPLHILYCIIHTRMCTPAFYSSQISLSRFMIRRTLSLIALNVEMLSTELLVETSANEGWNKTWCRLTIINAVKKLSAIGYTEVGNSGGWRGLVENIVTMGKKRQADSKLQAMWQSFVVRPVSKFIHRIRAPLFHEN